MALYLIVALDVLNGISLLFLLCLGLAIIFGMMKIINLAHGEFIMLGAYATVISASAGVNIWIAILIGHAARCALSVVRFNQGKWRTIRVNIGGATA